MPSRAHTRRSSAARARNWLSPGLGTTEFAVLELLYHKGPLPLGALRDRILVTGASTTYVVKKLEDRDSIRRRTSSDDQRVVFGELTVKGRALIDKVLPAHVERLRNVTAGLSTAEKRAASRLLRALSRHARQTTGERVTEDDSADAGAGHDVVSRDGDR